MTKTLDLGCGSVPRNPFHADALYGVDVRDNLDGNIRSADLATEPIPFGEASFDYVSAYDFIEHIPRVVYAPARRNAFVELMNEVHRVLKPGGLFLSHTPAYPHGVAFRDPTHVNIITDETLPLYFDDRHRLAAMYGFAGAFRVLSHGWSGSHLLTVLQKVAAPGAAPAPRDAGALISVVLALPAGAADAAGTVATVQAQTDPGFELLCIVDPAVDSAALQALAAADPRVRVLAATAPIRTVPAALDEALPLLRGGFVLHLHAGDRLAPDALQRLRERAATTQADAVLTADTAQAGVLRGGDAATLTPYPAERVLWDATLVRRIGFETFSPQALAYSRCRLLLACERVAIESPVLSPAATPETASAPGLPLTRLRIAELMREQGLPAPQVQAAFAAARAALQALQASAAASAQPEAAAFARRLALAPAFRVTGPPDFRTRQRLAKWKNSLRKLPGKLGLR